MSQSVCPTLDNLVSTEVGSIATLVAAIEDLTIQSTTLVVNLYARGVSGNSTSTFLDDLVLYTAGQGYNTFLLGILLQEVLTGLLVRTKP